MEPNEYDKENVLYCRDCLSLSIKGGRGIPDYCTECASTNIGDAPIKAWVKMFENTYGYNYLEGKPKVEDALEEYSLRKRNGIYTRQDGQDDHS